MSAKHTPGPWRVGREGGVGFFIVPVGALVHDGYERCAADACLIAAAPELLEALELVLAQDDGDLTVGARTAARAAIAKARGGK